MATAEDYAGWIVKNADKKGTPEFNTVAQAYTIAKGSMAEGPPQSGLQGTGGSNYVQQAKDAAGAIGPAILPTVGAALGAVGGAAGGTIMAPGPGTAAGGIIGEGLGSAGGEYLNQKLGITPPSNTAIAVQGLVPPAARAGMGLLNMAKSAILPRIPGAGAGLAEEGLQAANQSVGTIGTGLRPSSTIEEELATSGNPSLSIQNVGKAASELKSVEGKTFSPVLENANMAQLAKDVEKAAADPAGVPFDRIRLNLQRLNLKIRETRAAGGEEYNAYRDLREALQQDLDVAAKSGIPEAKLLTEFNQSYKMEAARDELSNLITKATNFSTGGFNAGQILNKLEKDPYFEKRFVGREGELDDLKKTFKEIDAYMAKIPAKPGTPVGSSQVNQGAIVGHVVGGNIGAAIGATAPGIIASAMMTGPGRAMIRRLAASPGGFTMDSNKMAMLAAATSGVLQGTRSANAIQPP